MAAPTRDCSPSTRIVALVGRLHAWRMSRCRGALTRQYVRGDTGFPRAKSSRDTTGFAAALMDRELKTTTDGEFGGIIGCRHFGSTDFRPDQLIGVQASLEAANCAPVVATSMNS